MALRNVMPDLLLCKLNTKPTPAAWQFPLKNISENISTDAIKLHQSGVLGRTFEVTVY